MLVNTLEKLVKEKCKNKAAHQSTTTSEHGGTEKSKEGDYMKKLIAFALALVCMVGLVGCSTNKVGLINNQGYAET